jgi:WhiB family redox-sensing transcriptional regulator
LVSVALGIVHDIWRVKAACKGPESYLFYPPSLPERREERDEREQAAKAICATCSVRRACLEHAVRIREQHGIWGGLTEAERRPLLDAAAAS